MSKTLSDYFRQFHSSSYYSQEFSFPVQNAKMKQIRYDSDGKRQALNIPIPEFHIEISSQCIALLKKDIAKSHKDKQGVLICYGPSLILDKIHYFTTEQEQDIGSLQSCENVYCIGFAVLKGSNAGNEAVIKRISSQLRKCLDKRTKLMQKSGKKEQLLSQHSENTLLKYQYIRMFLIFEKKDQQITVHKVIFAPKAAFSVRRIKIVPSKYEENKVLRDALKFDKNFKHGYLTFATKDNEYRMMLVQKDAPSENMPPSIGVWIAGDFSSKRENEESIWAAIIEYFQNSFLKKRLSINQPKTGLLFMANRQSKRSIYLFELPPTASWSLVFQTETHQLASLPGSYCISLSESIVKEERVESRTKPVRHQDLQKVNGNKERSQEKNDARFQKQQQKNCHEVKSSNTLEEKDLQIILLKKELEFYKRRCFELEKMVELPMRAYTGYTLPQIPSQQLTLSQLAGKEYGTSSTTFQKQTSNDQPNQITDLKLMRAKSSPPGKQDHVFLISRDSKNISFANESNFEDSFSKNPFEEHEFRSPEFKYERQEDSQANHSVPDSYHDSDEEEPQPALSPQRQKFELNPLHQKKKQLEMLTKDKEQPLIEKQPLIENEYDGDCCSRNLKDSQISNEIRRQYQDNEVVKQENNQCKSIHSQQSNLSQQRNRSHQNISQEKVQKQQQLKLNEHQVGHSNQLKILVANNQGKEGKIKADKQNGYAKKKQTYSDSDDSADSGQLRKIIGKYGKK